MGMVVSGMRGTAGKPWTTSTSTYQGYIDRVCVCVGGRGCLYGERMACTGRTDSIIILSKYSTKSVIDFLG